MIIIIIITYIYLKLDGAAAGGLVAPHRVRHIQETAEALSGQTLGFCFRLSGSLPVPVYLPCNNFLPPLSWPQQLCLIVRSLLRPLLLRPHRPSTRLAMYVNNSL